MKAAARDEGLAHLHEIAANYQSEIGLSRHDLISYLSDNISFSIDDPMREGLEMYLKLAAKHELIPQFRPLDFI